MKAAVIGCGRMGLTTPSHVQQALPNCWLPLSHSDALSLHPDFDLIALADPILESQTAAQSKFPSALIYSDALELITLSSLDHICIATRTPQRFELIHAAVCAGIKHLHVEKPLCSSMSELSTLEDILLSNSIHLTFGAIRRYLSPYLTALRLVESQVIGDIHEIQISLGPGPFVEPYSCS